ncbi:MAG: tetratricopeptide repeat protein [Flavobacteriales bacterium]
MNRFIVSIFFVTNAFFATGQENELKPDQQEFEKIMDVYYKKEFDSAVVKFQNFIKDFPNSELTGRAKYNIAYIYRETKQNDKAIFAFKEILNSQLNEKDAFGGIMEQYALYKHRSSAILADIYIEKKEYQTALEYNMKADKKYPYKHFHSRELIDNKVQISANYAKIYRGFDKFQKSLQYVLPYAFYDRNYIIEDIITSLDSLYSKEQIITELNKAKNNLILKKKNYALVELFGMKLKIYEELLYSDMNDPNIEQYFELKGIDIYKKIVDIHPLFKHYLK